MPRAIWSGAISFGLVNVPVKLYSAVSRKTVRFHQLEDKTGARIQQKRVSSASGDEVPYENIVKGYEIGPDRYVVISPDELEALDPKKTRTIDIQDFVDLSEIDPMYFDHPYYLVPGQGAEKPYALLRDAMAESGKVAIARVVIRSKENLVAIRASDNALTMSTMLFGDEVIPPDDLDELPGKEIEAGKRELQMAQQLIDSLSSDFDPDQYHDEYRERVLEMIERKAEGEEIAVAPEAEEPTPVPDLMAALEASISATQGSGAGKGRPKAASKDSAKKNGAAKRTKSGPKQSTSGGARSKSKARSKG